MSWTSWNRKLTDEETTMKLSASIAEIRAWNPCPERFDAALERLGPLPSDAQITIGDAQKAGIEPQDIAWALAHLADDSATMKDELRGLARRLKPGGYNIGDCRPDCYLCAIDTVVSAPEGAL